jgi:hypothetical protein
MIMCFSDTRPTNPRHSAGDYDFDHQANSRLNVYAKEFSANSRNQQRQAKPRGPQVLNANNIQQSISLGNMLSTSTSAVNIQTLLVIFLEIAMPFTLEFKKYHF